MYENFQSSHIWSDYSNSTFFHERDLAKGSTVIDYTVFGMAVITIGLLMVVGAVRYFIDAMAKGKFFFENVLEAVYHELSTLGLVEAGVFLILHYYPDLNINVKNVFAEVHFTLFYVAIINAIMSVLLYLFTSRVAEKQWVRMETIDLDHYVAIRKQFEAIEFALKEMEESDKMKKKTYNPVSPETKDEASNRGRKIEFADNNMTSQLSTRSTFEPGPYASFLKSLVRIPIFGNKRASLTAKHRKLLVQVRFHELRVHFIDCNKLDPRFKVSEYLKLCMNDVFHSLVHISFVTWLILLVFTNVVYFLLGVISAFADEATIGTILTWVHIGYSILFLLVSMLIANKMKNIFFLIMKNDHWVRRDGASETPTTLHRQMSMSNVREWRADRRKTPSQNTNTNNHTRQEDYFWGGDPAYIVFAAQVMQFGFALELGIMLVFNESVKMNIIDLTWWGFYLLVPLVAYLLFLWIWSFIIPQYTQCTSLGELIHSDHLNETQAMFKLTEARLLRQEEIDMAATEDAIDKRMISSRRGVRKKQLSTGGLIGKIFDSVHSSHKKDHTCDSFEDSCGDKLIQLSSFVRKDTKDLPDIEPSRRRRHKAVSDGVSAMRFFAPLSSSVKQALEGEMQSDFEDIRGRSSEPLKPLSDSYTIRQSRPRRLKSASTGVFMMRHGGPESLFADPSENQSNPFNLKSRDDNDVHMFSSVALSRVDESRPMSKESTFGISKDKAVTSSKTALNVKKSVSDQEKVPVSVKATNEDSHKDLVDHEVESDTESAGFPDLSEHPEFNFESVPEISFSEHLKSFFTGLKYRRLSAVFGTLLVFFILGTRMELILLRTCKIQDNENTWDYISLKSTFIMTTLWLCAFIFESSILIYTFYTSRLNSMVAAGLFDILLTITCLSIFLVAESQRCCNCEDNIEHRILASMNGSSVENCEIPCCPTFGTRLCGGIGTLEPFTSLIGFRLFRFVIGKWFSDIITKLKTYFNFPRLRRDEEKEVDSMSEDETEKEKDEKCEEIFNIFEHKEGTIADLWAASLIKFPDLVEKHGPFSGLLLEAMLGIQPLPSHIAQNNAPEVEGNSKPPLPSTMKKPKFPRSMSIGSTRSAIDSIDENERAFDRPASTLIRTMRRCQCKWLPLLDSWENVDVVLTKYELAWFGTVSVNSFWENEANEKDTESKSLLQKTGGGKGLRLCDVVSGRELLGRLQLSDIESVKVVRYPLETKVAPEREKIVENDEEFGKDASNFVSEYWQDMKQSTSNGSIDERWNAVTEDVLTIRTPQGTLCLRFLVDLVAAEETAIEKTGKISSSNRKRKEEGALLWCQTILYVQSKERGIHTELDQGGDGAEYYADFIEVVGDTKKQKRWFQSLERKNREGRKVLEKFNRE